MITQIATVPNSRNPSQIELHNEQAELSSFSVFFELLSQIDQRLKVEDPEYRAKYYPQE